MPSSVVCVSGLDGALMREVAHGVAERLGFQLVDEEIVLRAAAEAGVDPAAVADVERRRSFVERALATAGSTAGGFGPGGIDGFYAGGLAASPVSADLRKSVRVAIEETAERGRAVIVAHGASYALAEQPNVLRVLIIASRSTRQARVASERNLSPEDAARAIEASDAARADYLKRFYGAKSEPPTQYDVVLNTDRRSADEVVSVVVFAATN